MLIKLLNKKTEQHKVKGVSILMFLMISSLIVTIFPPKLI